jgi:hypothetical protein
VDDFSTEAWGDLPAEYLIEFADPDGVTQALVTVGEENLEVVWRPGYTPPAKYR